jgi:hypothetical protein
MRALHYGTASGKDLVLNRELASRVTAAVIGDNSCWLKKLASQPVSSQTIHNRSLVASRKSSPPIIEPEPVNSAHVMLSVEEILPPKGEHSDCLEPSLFSRIHGRRIPIWKLDLSA